MVQPTRIFDKSLQDKRDLAYLAVTSGNAWNISRIGKHKNDRELLLAGVKHDGKNYNELPDNLKNDKRILLRALPYAGLYIYSGAPSSLQQDREVVVEALRSQLRSLRSIP